MLPAAYKVYIDWAGDGTFTAARDDMTKRILDGRQPVTIAYGRDTARAGSPISAGEAAFAINNQSRDYSPDNAGSPLTGLVIPGRAVYIKGVLGGVDYPLWIGYLDDFDLQPDRGDRSITTRCVDGLGRLKGAPISTALYQGMRTGEALAVILDTVGWPAAARDLDAGATVMPYWWLSQTDAFDAVMDLVNSEGQPALVSVDTGNNFIFRDRHHRVTRTASTAVQSTWRASAIEPMISSPTIYDHGWNEIINSVTYEVPIRHTTSDWKVAWSAPGRLSVAVGQTLVISASGSTAFADALLPEQDIDYTATSGSVAISLNRYSGGDITVSVTAVGADAVVDGLQLRGRTVDTVTTVRVTVEDVASIAKYGRRTQQNSQAPTWAGLYDAQAIGEILIGRRAERLPTITTTMVAATTQRQTQVFTRRLSDRVHVVEPHTGLDADCFIERVTHSVGQGGAEHRATFALEKIPTAVTTPFTFDVAGLGFNDGKFQTLGFVSGTSAFRFDTASQGFDQGQFGY